MLDRIEVLLNRNLAGSPRARELVAQLAGRSVDVEVRTTSYAVRLASDGTALRLAKRAPPPAMPDAGSAATAAADAVVAGTPLALLALAGRSPETPIQKGEVTIDGETDVAQRFRELGLLLRPDIEEELSRLIGDVAAHRIASFARGVFDWGRSAGETTLRNVAEYISHERGDVVSRPEADSFIGGVEALRDRVARLEARLAYLEAKANEP